MIKNNEIKIINFDREYSTRILNSLNKNLTTVRLFQIEINDEFLKGKGLE